MANRGPYSRVESILHATINGEPYTKEPLSRVEEDLLELKAVIESGSGGTGDYNELVNKPSINGHELVGDSSSSELGIASWEDA